MSDYEWEPIKPLTAAERGINLAAMQSLYKTWHTAREHLLQSSAGNFQLFRQRLIRRMSVETGILEQLYDLDKGVTETLVEKGFVEELVTRPHTDIEPSRLIDLLKDHEAAIQLVMDCVAGNRDLTKGAIHEIHSVLTRHQDTTTAVDQFGNRVEVPLLKGRYKQQKNNPKRPNGTIHEYSPPFQVDSEMENLLEWLHEYRGEDPLLVAAWFHHRFTQIHPYQDGNGRVTRTLTTLILLRADLLPVVIDRDLRTEYIMALEAADFGDLKPLVLMLGRLQKTAILQALSIDADAAVAQERRLTTAVIENLAAKLGRRRRDQDERLRKVNEVAIALRSRASDGIDRALHSLENAVSYLQVQEKRVRSGGPDHDNAHWYKFEVVRSANESGKYVNFDENHYFVKATTRVDDQRLVLVVSLHHIGRQLSGIMEATAFFQLQIFENSEDRERANQEFFVCSLEPFVFAYQTEVNDIAEAFDQWLDASIAVAFKEFGERL